MGVKVSPGMLQLPALFSLETGLLRRLRASAIAHLCPRVDPEAGRPLRVFAELALVKFNMEYLF